MGRGDGFGWEGKMNTDAAAAAVQLLERFCGPAADCRRNRGGKKMGGKKMKAEKFWAERLGGAGWGRG